MQPSVPADETPWRKIFCVLSAALQAAAAADGSWLSMLAAIGTTGCVCVARRLRLVWGAARRLKSKSALRPLLISSLFSRACVSTSGRRCYGMLDGATAVLFGRGGGEGGEPTSKY